MRRKALIPLLLATVAFAGPALADEVLYFTNGTTMPILLHEADGDMIIVVLDGNAEMAFPMDQIDRIETAEGSVVRPGAMPKNRVVSSGATPVRGMRPTIYRRPKWDDGGEENTDIQRTKGGVATMALKPGSSVRVTGRREMIARPPSTTTSNGNMPGAVPYGVGYRVPFRGADGASRAPIGLSSK